MYAAQVPYSLRFEAQPSQFVMGGSPFERIPRVEVRDVAGAKIGDAALQVHLALERITPPPDPDAAKGEEPALLGTPHATSAFGLASYAGIGVAESVCAAVAGGGRCIAELVASAEVAVPGEDPRALLGARSDAFEVVMPGTAVQLAFVARPVAPSRLAPLTPSPSPRV